MAVLTLIYNGKKTYIPFDGAPLLKDLLIRTGHAVESPCGGKGSCGKCAVAVRGDISAPNGAEQKAGCRLACQTVLYGDAEAEINAQAEQNAHIQADTSAITANNTDFRYGAAVDIGTTTVVLKLFSADGSCLGVASALNPQRAFASDVIGRISASLNGNGEILKKQITDCIFSLLEKCCASAGIKYEETERMVITGNTAMMYLLTGACPESVARAPFEADDLFGRWITLFGINTYLMPCMNAFVGGDITAAVLDSGMLLSDGISLLCDIGTNGETALYKDGVLYVTSTAAGPAFEGAEISCGCGGEDGAVCRVWAEDGVLYAHTLGNLPATGICGSGIIDAVAAFLELGYIDETGATHKELKITANGGAVTLLPADIRALQLAKAAVAAGTEILLARSGTKAEEVQTLYLAGGFGNKLNTESAAEIGLFPAVLSKRARPLGNAALSGAVKILFDPSLAAEAERISSHALHISLGGSEDFNDAFIENIFFPE